MIKELYLKTIVSIEETKAKLEKISEDLTQDYIKEHSSFKKGDIIEYDNSTYEVLGVEIERLKDNSDTFFVYRSFPLWENHEKHTLHRRNGYGSDFISESYRKKIILSDKNDWKLCK